MYQALLNAAMRLPHRKSALSDRAECFLTFLARTKRNCKKVRFASTVCYLIVIIVLPVTNLKFWVLAMGLDIDVMVLDFEDGVALNQKPNARRLVADFLSKGDFGRTERTVRINSIKAGDDLYVLPIRFEPVDGLQIPNREEIGFQIVKKTQKW